MKTAEMYVLAQVNGKIYYSKDADAIYSKEWGLVEKGNIDSDIDLGSFGSLENLMESTWEEMTNIMSKVEAEEKFGIVIYD